MGKKPVKKSNNYLDYVFQRAPEVGWDEVAGEEGSADEVDGGASPEGAGDGRRSLVVLHIRHRGLSHFIAEKFFGRPQITHVHLEPLGSFIWRQIDGTRSVYEIGRLLREAFGEEAEPLYERLSVYMKQLENNGLIIRCRKA